MMPSLCSSRCPPIVTLTFYLVLFLILNIGLRFYQGMELEPGRYHVEVATAGRETERLWMTLGAGEDRRLNVRLNRIGVVAAPSPGVGAAAPDNKIRNSDLALGAMEEIIEAIYTREKGHILEL